VCNFASLFGSYVYPGDFQALSDGKPTFIGEDNNAVTGMEGLEIVLIMGLDAAVPVFCCCLDLRIQLLHNAC
jgi:hypothetical protein